MSDDHSTHGEGPDEAEMELLAAMRAAGTALDPVPDLVIEAAKAAWTWRTIDAELAELTYDSWTDDKELAGVRGAVAAPSSRLLSFEARDLAVELEIVVEGDRRRLVGQIVPPSPGRGRGASPAGRRAGRGRHHRSVRGGVGRPRAVPLDGAGVGRSPPGGDGLDPGVTIGR